MVSTRKWKRGGEEWQSQGEEGTENSEAHELWLIQSTPSKALREVSTLEGDEVND